MNRNLFYHEIKRNSTGLVIWAILITVLISVTMSVFQTFIQNQSKIMGMLSLVPKGALQFKGISNFSDLLSVLGFYAVNNIIYMMVLGSIYSIVIASNILLREEYNKTAEFLVSRPLTRSEIFISKASVVFINILLLNLVTSLAGFIAMEIVRNEAFSIRSFMILSFYTLLLNILFGALGLFLSTVIKRPRSITTFSIGLVLIFYFIYTLSKITESVSKIGYLSPFKFVDLNVTGPDYTLAPGNFAYFTVISLLLVAVAYRLYLKRDVYT